MNAIEKQVLKIRPDWYVVDGYFFEFPQRHVLSGFAYERASTGYYLGVFFLPLYDKFAGMHWTYGGRFRGLDGHLIPASRAPRAVASAFVERFDQHRHDLLSGSTLEEFLAHLALLPRRSSWVLRASALTKLMTGRLADASIDLEELSGRELPTAQSDCQSGVALLRDSMRSSPGSVRAILETWEAETLSLLSTRVER